MIFDNEIEAIRFMWKTYLIRLTPLTRPGGPDYDPIDPNEDTYSDRTRKFDEIRDWCVDQFGQHMVRYNWATPAVNGIRYTRFKVDETRRWINSSYFYAFQYETDAVIFRLRWPCREWTNEDDVVHGYRWKPFTC